MKGVPPTDGPPEDIDEHYRRASAGEQSGPSDRTRQAILAHAAQLQRKRGATGRRWKPAIYGSLMAAGLAGLLITPHFLNPRLLPTSAVSTSAGNSQPATSEVRTTVLSQGVTRAATAPPSAPRPHPYRENSDSSAKTASPMSAPSAPSAPAASAAGATLRAPQIGQFANAQYQKLRRAAEFGSIAELHSLLDDNVGLESRDSDGRTALLLAALNGRSDSVDELLAHGADPNAADAHGLTPLGAARSKNYPQIAAALERAGAR